MASRPEHQVYGSLYGLTALSDVASYLGAADHAPRLYEALTPFADHLAVIHPGLTAVASIHQPLGQLSALMGDRHRSEVHFDGEGDSRKVVKFLAILTEMGGATLTAELQ